MVDGISAPIGVTVATSMLELDALLPGHGYWIATWGRRKQEEVPISQGCALPVVVMDMEIAIWEKRGCLALHVLGLGACLVRFWI